MLPLAYRVRNPPAVLVGRERERGWLDAARRRGPLTVITGAPGIGKTALALDLLHRVGDGHEAVGATPRGIMATAPHIDQAMVEVIRALALGEALAPMEWAGLAGASDMLVATALDLAERNEWNILLDGVGDDASLHSVLSLLAAYARRSRWLVTTRAPIELTEAPEQVLALGALADGPVAELVRALLPHEELSEDEARQLVARSEGSPATARRLALERRRARSHDAPLPPARDDRAPSTATAPVLGSWPELLAIAEYPVTEDTLAAATAAPRNALRAALEAAASEHRVEPTPDGWRATEAERDASRRTASSRDRREHALTLVHALSARDDVRAWVHALLLASEHGLDDEVTQIAADRGPRMLDAGYAPEVWRVLEARAQGPLAALHVRCATLLGVTDALRRAVRPSPTNPRALLDWASARIALGELDAGLDAARQARDSAGEAGDVTTAFDAALVEVRALANRGETERRRATLEALTPPGEDAMARRDVRLAQCLFEMGEHARAAALARGLLGGAARLGDAASREVGYGAARVLYHLGELTEASAALHLRGEDDDLRVALYERRQRLTFRAAIALERGELDRCAEILSRLGPYVPRGSLQHRYVDLIEVQRRLARGALDGLAAELEGHVAFARRQESAPLYYASVALRVRLGTLLGEATDANDPSAPWRDPDGPVGFPAPAPYDQLVPLAAAGHRATRALATATMADPVEVLTTEPAAVVEVALAKGLVTAVTRFVTGDLVRAERTLGETIELASRHGFRLRGVDASLLRADVLVCLGRFPELASALDSLEELAAPLGSALVTQAVSLLRMAQGGSGPDPHVLEQLATSTSSPATARRARALLGAGGLPQGLNAGDHRVVAALEARFELSIGLAAASDPRRLSGDWSEGWGIIEGSKTVWLPRGRTVELARRPQLWKLLWALAITAQPTKEELVERVWGEREYHPLRHDNRLQAAIRQLRHLVEDAPKHPLRVVTWEDGYRLSSAWPVTLWRARGAASC